VITDVSVDKLCFCLAEIAKLLSSWPADEKTKLLWREGHLWL